MRLKRFLPRPTAAAALFAAALSTQAHAQSAGKQFHLIAANTNNSTLLKGQSGIILGAQVGGVGSAPAYLKFYDKSTAPTCGTDTPSKVVIIPAAATAANGAASNVSISFGAVFNSGIGICVTTGIADSDNTAPAAATFIINVDYE